MTGSETAQSVSNATSIVLAVLLILALLWDTYVFHTHGREQTISFTFHTWLRDEPLVVVLMFVMLWHFVWPLK